MQPGNILEENSKTGTLSLGMDKPGKNYNQIWLWVTPPFDLQSFKLSNSGKDAMISEKEKLLVI